jgi:transposase
MARISREEKEIRMKVYIGIDWSENKHDVCFLDKMGEVLLVQEIAHTIAGFRQLDQARQSLGVGRGEVIIGLETAHNLLVDYLWEQGYEQIYVLPPAAVQSAQKRYRQSGAKDDAWDAHLIANLLRTDQHCYTPWQPDQPLTRQIRAEVRFAQQLGQEVVRDGNRLRSLVLRYYPAALDAFPHLDSLVCLAFLQAYPTLSQAQALSFEQLKVFLREHHHTQVRSWPTLYAGLHSDHPQSNPELDAAYAPLAQAQARILETLIRSRNACLTRLDKLFLLHPDHEIYDSLPQAGALLAPALLAQLGDTCTALRLVQCRCDRARYPTPAVLQAVAGTCPLTKRSGKHSYVLFRKACDRDFRHIVQQWAHLSLDASPWAATYYHTVRPHCRTDNDAVRRLANRWLEVLWRLWMDRKPYDEVFHLKQHVLRMQAR